MIIMRVRVNYFKSDSIRFTGHLDFQRVWERTLRRSRLPVAYSQGFNPQARIQIACALPLGFTSRCELLDFWLKEAISVEEIRSALTGATPPGLSILEIHEVEDHLPALQTQVIATEYHVTLLDAIPDPDLDHRIEEIVSSPSISRIWRNKPYDLRPLLETLERLPMPDGSSRLGMLLAARQNATGRPEEVLAALGLDPTAALYERTRMILA